MAQFYADSDYTGGVAISDRIVVAERGGTFIGVYRLAREQGVLVLRGMRVHRSARREGIGRQLLEPLRELEETCYCVAHAHLGSFYALVGFVEAEEQDSPPFLRERVATYRGRGLDVLLMKREPPRVAP